MYGAHIYNLIMYLEDQARRISRLGKSVRSWLKIKWGIAQWYSPCLERLGFNSYSTNKEGEKRGARE